MFVYRGYGKDSTNSVVDFQRDSLIKAGAQIECFPITNSKIKGYVKTIFTLREYLKNNQIDLIHSHFSYSGFVAAMAFRKKVVCSLMGSDILQKKGLLKIITKLFINFFWSATIVKSGQMLSILPETNVHHIPNGVDFENFKPMPKEEALKVTGYDPSKKNIIFVAQDPHSKVKNFQLAKKSVECLNDKNILLHTVSNKSFDELPFYYNSADVLLLTSLSEGSPNVLKEAMACNTPIVSVNVGDAKDILSDTDGTYICNHEYIEVSRKISEAIKFSKRTNGREAIKHLDNKIISEKIINLYDSVLV